MKRSRDTITIDPYDHRSSFFDLHLQGIHRERHGLYDAKQSTFIIIDPCGIDPCKHNRSLTAGSP
eukprot:945307-Pelagomonas_calceolata.AAC.1